MSKFSGGLAARSNALYSLNPQNKPPDLISFDAFADDSDLNALSHEPSAPASEAAPTTSVGLPLDLFSSPAQQDLFSAPQQSQQSSKPRQDPMAFFNLSAPTPPPQGQGSQLSSNMFGTFASASGAVSGSSTPSSNPGFGAGISLPLTPSTAPGPAAASSTGGTASQGKARDPFADLASW